MFILVWIGAGCLFRLIYQMSWFCKELYGKKTFQCEELNNSGVIQAFSTRDFGNMALHTGDEPGQVVIRRETFLTGIGLRLDDLIAGKQIHGTKISVVDHRLRGAGAHSYENAVPGTDALITRETGILLSIFTADCFPVFIYDPSTPAIGIAHAGWRGTINRIAFLTVKKMMEEFKADPTQFFIAFGPAIGSECFEVDPDLAAKFEELYPEVVLKNRNGYWVDLGRFNSIILQEIGINPARIIDAGICTSCQPHDFYSYRFEKGTMGRMMGVIALT